MKKYYRYGVKLRGVSLGTQPKKAHEMEIEVDENLLSYWGKQELKNIK